MKLSTKKEIFSYARRTIVKVSVCSDSNIETYKTGIDKKLRNESKTHFEWNRESFMHTRIFPLIDQWTSDKEVQIHTPFQPHSVSE
jgi:hypothetical protein